MVQFASYLRRVLCKTRLIFPRINGPSVSFLASHADVLRDSSRFPAPRTSAVIGLRFFPLKSEDVRGTRDGLLRTSTWEARSFPSSLKPLFQTEAD